MKIAVLGSTGQVGKYFVEELQARGHAVRTLRRKPPAESVNYEVVQGDALVPGDVERLVEGCDAVVNCAGRFANELGFFENVTRNILSAMKRFGVKRIILITGINVRTEGDRSTFLSVLTAIIFGLFVPKMRRDKEAEVQLLRTSETQWTVFRLPMVSDGRSVRPARALEHKVGGLNVLNHQVAKAVATELSENAWVGRLPVLFS